MKTKIVRLEIRDKEMNDVLDTYYLISPNKKKLEELKHMIECRHDYMFVDNLTDEEYEKAEELADNIWDAIDIFISANFITLDIEETYEIEY